MKFMILYSHHHVKFQRKTNSHNLLRLYLPSQYIRTFTILSTLIYECGVCILCTILNVFCRVVLMLYVIAEQTLLSSCRFNMHFALHTGVAQPPLHFMSRTVRKLPTRNAIIYTRNPVQYDCRPDNNPLAFNSFHFDHFLVFLFYSNHVIAISGRRGVIGRVLST